MSELNFSYKSAPEKILKQVFGYDSFRPMQKEIIEQVLSHQDTVAIMPTGGGKSLCYQIPALLQDGITIVVSPLIALMHDQVSALQNTGVEAVFLSSSQDWDTYFQSVASIKNGKAKLLYLSPEALSRTEKIQQLLTGINVNCITIDEAHCISEWGHDFRPDYRCLAEVRKLFPNATCLALTATATEAVKDDIIKNLSMKNPKVFVASFNRPNIFLEVASKSNPFLQIKRCLDKHSGESGIIYCFSRKQVDELTEKLNKAGYDALNYHAGLSDKIRSQNQNLFIRDKVKIMIATVAFGMGINKPNVRFVIHYDMPKSLEQYYQEIGRAGRDGEDSHALLLYSPADIHKIRFFLEDKNEKEAQNAERLLQQMINYASSRRCRRNILLSYFGDINPAIANINKNESCDSTEYCCDICSSAPPEMTEITIPAQKLLSCILRTGQKYGMTYVVDVLLGSRQRRILDNGHEKLSTWGIGKDLIKEDWYELTSCLIEYGYLKRTSDYNVLILTQNAKEALQKRSPIILPITLTKAKTEQPKEKIKEKSSVQIEKPKKYILATDDIEGQRILNDLKALRRRLAEDEDLPPYIIFADKTLVALAVEKPKTREALLDIHGIGSVKAERYGRSIIRIINGE